MIYSPKSPGEFVANISHRIKAEAKANIFFDIFISSLIFPAFAWWNGPYLSLAKEKKVRKV